MSGTTNDAEQRAFSEREKFVTAFNETMLKIWKEQMTLLDVIDTGALLASPKSLPLRADGRFMELGLSQSFLEYGLWQNFGTGKEIPRGNNGDIGREQKETLVLAQVLRFGHEPKGLPCRQHGQRICGRGSPIFGR